MNPSAPSQLALTLPRTHTQGAGRFTFSSAMARHPARSRVEQRLAYCLTFFPELETRTIPVGLTRQALGLASLDDFAIWLNPWRLSLHVIAHELTHLLQAEGRVPHGERSCDLYALARHPSLNDAEPGYVEVPASILGTGDRPRAGWPAIMHRLAGEAIRRREGGLRRYIRWFETELAAAAERRSPGGVAQLTLAASPTSADPPD